MRNLWRLSAYLRRHWKMFLTGMLIMGTTVILEGASIGMLYPIFKQMFEDPSVRVDPKNYDSRPLTLQLEETWNESKPDGSLFDNDTRKKWRTVLSENFTAFLNRNDPLRILTNLCIILLVILIIRSVTLYFYHYIFGVLEELFCKEMRDELFVQINRHSLRFFDKFRTGDLISRMVNDIEFLKRVVVANVAESIFNLTKIVMYFGMAFIINYKLTLFVMAITPPMMLVLDFIAKKLKKYSYRSQVEAAGMINVLEEAIVSMRVILAFFKHLFIQKSFENETQNYFRSRRKMVKYNVMNRPVSEYVTSTLGVIIFWYAGSLMMKENATLDFAGFMIFFAALYSTFHPMRTMARIYNDLQKGLGVVVRYFEVYDYEVDIYTDPNAVIFDGLQDSIKFEDVTFGYSHQKKALSNLNLNIKNGEIIALVGPSGGGKTTIANLIARFYDPHEGSIYIDETDLKEIDLKSLREKIGLVTQDTILFHDSVFNNIAFGLPDTEPDKVYDAAKAAYAHDFILKLPEGYDTIIGERGSRLSGGQKQRIAIARAILNDPEIIIFDEATSALDSEAEILIQQAMENIIRGRTVIMIAHRLSTIRKANRILVIEKGKIIEEGIHEELIEANGQYKYFHDLQFNNGEVDQDHRKGNDND